MPACPTILRRIAPIALALGVAAPAAAATPCAKISLPADLAGLGTPRPVEAAADAAGAAGAVLTPGTGVRLTLPPQAAVRYRIAPERPAATGSRGGLLTLGIAVAGTYRIALSDAAWIDVLEGGASVESTAHGHGEDCSGVRKMVDFTLAPGEHLVQIVGAPADAITLWATRRD